MDVLPEDGQRIGERHLASVKPAGAFRHLALSLLQISQAKLGHGDAGCLETSANQLALDAKACEKFWRVGEMAEWFNAHAWKM